MTKSVTKSLPTLALALFACGINLAQADGQYDASTTYTLDAWTFADATFQVTGNAELTSFEGTFGTSATGNIFAAIVDLGSASAPSIGTDSLGNPVLNNTVLKTVSFNPIGTIDVPLNLNLITGNYAIVLYGIDNSATLAASQIDSPNVATSQNGSTWIAESYTNLHPIFASPVPEADTISMMLLGMGLVGMLLGRKAA